LGHPAYTCPGKEKILAAWKEKKAAANNGTEKKEKFNMTKRRGSGGASKKGGCGGVVLATVPFWDHFYYRGSKKTRNQPVRFQFLPNGSLD